MAEIKIELRKFSSTRRFEIYGELDVTSSEDFPLSLTMQNFDIRDINSRSGSFSKTFDIPATNNNNRIFKNVFTAGYQQDYAPIFSKIDSVIYADNVPIISGKLRMTKIMKSNNVDKYSCEFVGDNMDWASDIKNLELKDLRFNPIFFPANPDIVGSYVYDGCHTRNAFGAPENDGFTDLDFPALGNDYTHFSSNFDRILWPLTSVGEGLSDRNQVTTGDFIPAFFAKNIWDKIFEGQGYTVVSTFCESNFFKSLIIPFEFEKRAEQVNNKFGKIILNSEVIGNISTDAQNNCFRMAAYFHSASSPVSASFLIGSGQVVRKTGIFNFADGSSSGVHARWLFGGNEIIDDYDAPLADNTGNVQMGTSTSVTNITDDYAGTMLVINEQGDHELDFNITARFVRDADTGGTDHNLGFYAQLEIWEVSDDDADANGLYQTVDFIENGNGSANPNFTRIYSKEYSYEADAPQNITRNWSPSAPIQVSGIGKKFIAALKMRPRYSPTGNSVTFGWEAESYMQISGTADMSVGEPITEPHFFLPDGKQSDFVMGLAQMFNLQFHTDPLRKRVFIEPYDFFYESKTDSYDWSDKIDYSKQTVEEFPHELKSEIRVKYKDASNDAFLERFNSRNLIDWGEYKEIDTTGIFQDGTYTIENKFFSPSFNWYEPEYIDTDIGHHISRAPLIPIYHRDYSYLMAARFADRADKNFQIGARILLTVPLYTKTDAGAGTDVTINNGAAGHYNSALSGNYTGYSYNDSNELEPSNAFNRLYTRANFIHFDNICNPDGTTEDLYRQQLSIGTYSNPKAFNVPVGSHIMIDPNLSFNDAIYYHAQGGDFADGYTHPTNPNKVHRLRGLFYNFYNRMFKQLKNRPKIRVSYFKLSYQDILIMDFRRLVYLDGIYYRINKVIDYKPHREESTKVELVEFFDLGKDDVLDGDMMDFTNGINI